jgi:hypothetical protein
MLPSPAPRHVRARHDQLHSICLDCSPPKLHFQVIELLVSTGLLAPGTDEGAVGASRSSGAKALTYAAILAAGGGSVSITRAGYEFLLRDTAVQLWTFLSAYLTSAESREMRTIDILVFLLELGFCSAGSGYALSALTEKQRTLLDDFTSFGLVYVPDEQEPMLPEQMEVEALAAAQAAGASLGENNVTLEWVRICAGRSR